MPLVLIIDDDARHSELLERLLERGDYAMSTAASAEAGLAMLSRLAPDLVITDVNLPGMSGLQLVRRLKGDAALRRIPVLVLSGHAMPEDEAVARAAGCDGYLVKPTEGDQLRAEVDRLLRS